MSSLVVGGGNDCATPDALPALDVNGELFVAFDTAAATQQATQGQNSGCGAIGRDVWFAWTAPARAGIATIDACATTTPTALDTVIAVYAGTACPLATAAITCNDNTCGSRSRVSFGFTAGQQFLIQLGQPGNTPTGGQGTLHLTICQRNRAGCGSLLVYPEWNNSPGEKTLYTITHAVADTTVHMQNVIVEVVYVRKSTCGENNFTLTLTPYDTISHITNLQNPNVDTGFIYAFAKNCTIAALDNTCPIVFNSLIGMETLIDGIQTFDYSINAISFRGLGAELSLNDDGIRPGIRELDDSKEYEGAPNQILIPRFLGQDDAPPAAATNNINSDIILLSLSTPGPITLAISVNSTNGTSFVCQSDSKTFSCWDKRPLRDLSAFTLNSSLVGFTNNDLKGFPPTVPPPPTPTIRTGWISLDATTPDVAFYAVLVEKAGAGTPQAAADLPFEQCSQGDGRLRPIQ
ncbi:MAG: hypothetical protein HZA53_15840 [Planctomycetes bacterium]|nr:hypothetical protein [Planctomycetota bacterium]